MTPHVVDAVIGDTVIDVQFARGITLDEVVAQPARTFACVEHANVTEPIDFARFFFVLVMLADGVLPKFATRWNASRCE